MRKRDALQQIADVAKNERTTIAGRAPGIVRSGSIRLRTASTYGGEIAWHLQATKDGGSSGSSVRQYAIAIAARNRVAVAHLRERIPAAGWGVPLEQTVTHDCGGFRHVMRGCQCRGA